MEEYSNPFWPGVGRLVRKLRGGARPDGPGPGRARRAGTMRSGALRSEARGRGFGPGAPSRAPRALVPLIIMVPEGGFHAGPGPRGTGGERGGGRGGTG